MGNLINDAADFILENSTYKDKEKLKERIAGHLCYKTCYIMYDTSGAIVAVVLWNITDNDTVEVIDMVIRKDHRGKEGKGIIKKFLTMGREIWPVKYMKYNRDYTLDGSSRWPEPKVFNVQHLLRRLG